VRREHEVASLYISVKSRDGQSSNVAQGDDMVSLSAPPSRGGTTLRVASMARYAHHQFVTTTIQH
jgi:hypothetical protein